MIATLNLNIPGAQIDKWYSCDVKHLDNGGIHFTALVPDGDELFGDGIRLEMDSPMKPGRHRNKITENTQFGCLYFWDEYRFVYGYLLSLDQGIIRIHLTYEDISKDIGEPFSISIEVKDDPTWLKTLENSD